MINFFSKSNFSLDNILEYFGIFAKQFQIPGFSDLKIPDISKRIRITGDLSKIITIDSQSEVDPEEVKMTKKDVELIWKGVINYYKTGVHPAIVLCVRREGKIVIKRSIGHCFGNGPDDLPDTNKKVINPDTPICQFSASKAVTAMLIHSLVEKGKIHLNDPVSFYIPEFGKNGKEDITIFHVLSHRSGFPTIPDYDDPEILFNYDDAVKKLCDSKPVYQPGHKPAYHAITGGYILGEIIKRVTNKDIREVLDETIKKPLGFKYFNFGAEENEIENIAQTYQTGPPVIFPFTMIVKKSLGGPWELANNIARDPRFLKVVIPSANLIATADEMSQFFQMLLNNGELNGVRVFDPLTVRRATIEAGKIQIDNSMVVLPMRYSPGFMLGSDPISLYGPYTSKVFGHWGFINCFSWADPERNTAVSLLNTGKPFLSPHLVQHFDLLARISKHTKK